MRMCAVALMIAAGILRAQDGQQGPRAEWPCVAGRAVDPSYIDISESSGGQLFLFQKSEVAQSGLVMSASYTHPATVVRAVGHLSGSRDFDFPVDSTMESMLVLASLQCRTAIRVTRPNGMELTDRNSAQSVDLQAGRILRVEHPEPGRWRVRLTGTGLFVLSVLAKSDLRVGAVRTSQDGVSARIAGDVSQVKLQLVDAAGDRLPGDQPTEVVDGLYRAGIRPAAERYRIVATGTDASAWPFQRMHPNLLRASQLK
ncbi:MAG TPA: hypothetical protein VGF59_03250 [Bryobacteraceae bacterium]|jgi:hypothetical protein